MARGIYTSLDVLVLNPGVKVGDEQSRVSSRLEDDGIKRSLGFVGSQLLGVAPIISSTTS